MTPIIEGLWSRMTFVWQISFSKIKKNLCKKCIFFIGIFCNCTLFCLQVFNIWYKKLLLNVNTGDYLSVTSRQIRYSSRMLWTADLDEINKKQPKLKRMFFPGACQLLLSTCHLVKNMLHMPMLSHVLKTDVVLDMIY